MTAFASILVLLSATTLDNSRETTVWVHFLESARVGDASPPTLPLGAFRA